MSKAGTLNIDMKQPELNLANILGGAVMEVWDDAVNKVLLNVADVSTTEAARVVTLKFKMTPTRKRDQVEVEFSCESKLAGAEGVKGNIFIDRRGGKIQGYGENPAQMSLLRKETETDLAQ